MNVFAERFFNMKRTNPDITERMPNDAETALYNTIFTYMEKNEEIFAKLDKLAWTKFFNYKIDEYDQQKTKYGYYLLDEGLFGMGNCIYKFAIIDFLLSEIENLRQLEGTDIPSFAQELNKEFERVNYGFRIICNHITPITDPEEIIEIENANQAVPDNIRVHLNCALHELSKKNNADYRVSVHESLSAVEAFCENYTGTDVLSKALYLLDKKKKLHPQIIKAFENLYCYSSDKKTGARHGLAVEDDTYVPTYYEARFMFVACSAFINYLRGKFVEDLDD